MVRKDAKTQRTAHRVRKLCVFASLRTIKPYQLIFEWLLRSGGEEEVALKRHCTSVCLLWAVNGTRRNEDTKFFSSVFISSFLCFFVFSKRKISASHEKNSTPQEKISAPFERKWYARRKDTKFSCSVRYSSCLCAFAYIPNSASLPSLKHSNIKKKAAKNRNSSINTRKN